MLTAYKAKRDFKKTSEPSGAKRSSRAKELSYVVQKHAASHLHYDFRLELDGVLKSWAVPKGPSLNPHRKSLAVQVEDHPVEYGDFEGTIPKGQYGGGSVLLWDRGTWEPLEEPHEALKNGKMRFVLHGEKLRGEWTLVRFHGDKKSDKPNWLLIKARDEFASENGAIIEAAPRSVKSNRVIDEISDSNTTDARSDLPRDIALQLATWTPQPPHGDEWLHEVKFDGYRLIARIQDGKCSLITRGGQDWTAHFPRLAKELAAIPGAVVLDGEVVVLDSHGVSQFQLLQNTWKSRNGDADPIFFAFDLLFQDGTYLRSQPLIERKAVLTKLLRKSKLARVKFSDYVVGNGDAVVARACKMALEGIVSKRLDAPYQSGLTRTWLKSKCGYRQEFIIIGYTDPQGSRAEFGSLLLGYHDKEGHLLYAGRVGTGFDAALLKQIKREMAPHARTTPPTANAPAARERRLAHWLEPRLVAEVKFAGWTQDNLVRQATFLGLRKDKRPQSVVREDQMPALTTKRVKSSPTASSPPSSLASGPPTDELKLTHPDRVIFPEEKLTKSDMADYYAGVASRMLPHVANRPLTLLRCPAGAGTKCFIQRQFTENLPPAIEAINIAAGGKPDRHMLIRDAAGLRALVQINALEIHAWGSTAEDMEHPDRLIFDLDPDENLPWSRVVAAANEIKDVLQSVKLSPLVKVTGGKGVHIVVPIIPNVDWEHAKAFCKSIADEMVKQDRQSFTANVRKNERPGRIFIDYLRNGRGATVVVPYSVRARAGAPVSAPVPWDELLRLKAANQITLPDMLRRMKHSADDPWADYESNRVDLRKITGVI